MSSESDPDEALGASYDIQYYIDLLEEYMPTRTSTDYGIAMFLLVLSSALLVVFSCFMVVFFLKRDVFEIRARSPFLVMLSGACAMTSLPLTIALERAVIFDAELDAVPYVCTSYFIMVCSTCCYGSRTIRLAVMRNARVRRAAPWLMSEWNHVGVCFLLGAAALGFPLYTVRHMRRDSPFAELVFYVRSDKMLWRLSVVCQAVVLALWVINRKTDDIFNITGELRVAMVSQLLVTLAGKLAEDHLSAPYDRWFNRANFGVPVAFIVFYVSVVNPLRRLWWNPLESSDPEIGRSLAKRREGLGKLGMRDGQESSAATEIDEEFASDVAHDSNVIWVYEEVAKIPEVSAAFDTFSRKALCYESVLFLKAVRSYQSKSDGGWEAEAGGSGERRDHDKYSAFTQIVLRFIMNGAPDEVNLSWEDKSAILHVHEAGGSGFFGLGKRERRFVFAHAYAEVRYIVEANLMKKFVASAGFKAAAVLTGTTGEGYTGPIIVRPEPDEV